MKNYHLEAIPAYEQLPGTRVMSDAVIFTCVFRDCTDCGVILFHLTDGSEVRIPFTDAMRFGDLYSAKISNIRPAEWGYRYYRDGVSFVDPWMKRLVTLQDGTNASGLYPVTEDGFRPSPAGTPDFSAEWIYVFHVRGLTASRSSGVRRKGTFDGVCEKIPYLKSIGAKAVELMPVYEPAPARADLYADASVREPQADEPGSAAVTAAKDNFWNFGEGWYMAPRNRYAASGDAQTEFATMVQRFHEAGIRVYLMMHFPDTVSVQTQHEAIKFYVTHYQVDGFHLVGSDAAVRTVVQDPLLAGTAVFHSSFQPDELMQSGCFFPAYCGKPTGQSLCEYNDSYRRLIRSYVKGDPQSLQPFLRAFTAVPESHGRVIYATNYDGFTLHDLVTYSYKHNEANGEENRDGENDNQSWNCGIEGESRKKEIRVLRGRQVRNILTLLFLSQGTPLIFSGDEAGNSQDGNNNPWCQDNETGWVTWKKNAESKALTEFFASLTAFRQAHPVFHRRKSFSYTASGSGMLPEISLHGKEAWKLPTDGSALSAGVLYAADGDILYIGMNMHWERCELGLPKLPAGYSWYVVLNTFEDEPFYTEPVLLKEQHHLLVRERSVCVLTAMPEETGRERTGKEGTGKAGSGKKDAGSPDSGTGKKA